MKTKFSNCFFAKSAIWTAALACAALWAWSVAAAPQATSTAPAASKAPAPAVAPTLQAQKRFDTPQKAADALVRAAADFNVAQLMDIFGPDGHDIVFSGEFAQDRQHAT